MKFRLSSVVLLLAISGLAIVSSLSGQSSSAPANGAKRAITEKDLFNFIWIADPQVSPDGSRVVFTRVVTDEKHTGYETSIWMVATSGNETPVRLTNGKHDAHGRADGRRTESGSRSSAGERRMTAASLVRRKLRSWR